MPGMPYFRSNRVAPRARRFVAIFRATVCGEPTNSAPSGPASQSNLLVVGIAKPRSAATSAMVSRPTAGVAVPVAEGVQPDGVRRGFCHERLCHERLCHERLCHERLKRTLPRLYSGVSDETAVQ